MSRSALARFEAGQYMAPPDPPTSGTTAPAPAVAMPYMQAGAGMPMPMPAMQMPAMQMPLAMGMGMGMGMGMPMGMGMGMEMGMGYMPPQGAYNQPPEEVVDPKNVLPLHGNEETFNINNMLINNIFENEYFRALNQLNSYHEVIDEIYRSVKHVEPWSTGTSRMPSSAFCLMVKFLQMKLTVNQMKGLLNTEDNPLVRAIGKK